jgi:hypothetical protein
LSVGSRKHKNQGSKAMSTRLFGLVLATILLASFQPAQAQQPKKVPRDLSLELAMPTILGRVPRHSGRVCASLAM